MKAKTQKPEFLYVTYINTTPRKLWKALVDPKLIREYWMGRHNTSSWKKGAVLESRSPDGELEWQGKILESEPPHRLVYSFQGEESKEAYTRVTFLIESVNAASPFRGKGVKLTVTHTEFEQGSKLLQGISTGWPAILSSLKSLLETGESLGFSHAD